MIRTRFAPSPTGFLHIGNARTALINFLLARRFSGNFILRIDDTDIARSKKEYIDAIKKDMEWLMLDFDELYMQSSRLTKYENAKQFLIEQKLLYPCYETQEELNIKKRNLISKGLPFIYDRESFHLSDSQKKEFEDEGRKPHWRFFIRDGDITWNDGIKGAIRFNSRNLSDPILIRSDGSMTYHISSIVDDIDLGITDIVRGDDHIANSALHIKMFEAFGKKHPNFMHLPLLQSINGQISKRYGNCALHTLKAKGIEAMSINSFLAKVGTSSDIKPYFNLTELINEFDITKFSKSAIKYQESEIERINSKLIHSIPYKYVRDQIDFNELKELGIAEDDKNIEEFWNAIQNNIDTIKQIKDWLKICKCNIVPIIDDAQYTQFASTLLPNEPWNKDTWTNWTNDLHQKTSRKGSELFLPLRKALTGMKNGPEMGLLMPFIGKKKAYSRLQGLTA
ncbi:MAG: glutamate--tRNA ligase [Proteobacteria bacterium]|nr:glutamate--tRNA ligase [Pseudomonadota bacterium]